MSTEELCFENVWQVQGHLQATAAFGYLLEFASENGGDNSTSKERRRKVATLNGGTSLSD